ncbi:hypothetical protein PT974_10383 [Cladobotryum mycophilum]|uniref:Uncharacterized protein n=1 Tax=Cladobotryum mycophilum TaxID=491253 RepID=A0ABR0S9Q4_9HYPO
MPPTIYQRIQVYCQIIWGEGDYDLDNESDDYETHYVSVRKDFGTSFGPPLTTTGLCKSSDHAYRELERMLGLWAGQIQSGQPMTRELQLAIFGGPRGRHKALLSRFLDLKEEKEAEAATKTA